MVAVGGTRLQARLAPAEHGQNETVWNGDGAGGGGCSVPFTAQPWQQSRADWSSVGCGKNRAVADVSADADPYTGVAVYDSEPECEDRRRRVRMRHWCTIGGTSLASPIIASTFALAGGAAGVAYPAQTLYENELADPASLHDVTSGIQRRVRSRRHFSTMRPGSPTAEESIEGQLLGEPICNAGPGYDGPTGVGTPNGITAFEPVSEEVKRTNEARRQWEAKVREEERQREEKKKEEEEEEEEAAAAKSQSGGSGGETREAFAGLSLPPGAQPAGPPLSIAGPSAILPVLSALALTRNATIALRHDPARISRIAFAFTLNVPARVRVTLAEQVLAHGHTRWQVLPDSLTVAAARGRDSAHLRAHGTLSPGRYRLTLTPLRGRSRSIRFRVG